MDKNVIVKECGLSRAKYADFKVICKVKNASATEMIVGVFFMERLSMSTGELISTERLQYNNIDLIKFIMAFAVVAIHTNPLVDCKNDIVQIVYNNIVNMAVPFFFLTTGFLLSERMSFSNKASDISILGHYIGKILKMYFIWMVLYTPLTIYHVFDKNISLKKAMSTYLQGIIFTGEQYNAWPLWYLLSTVYTLCIVILLLKLNASKNSFLIVSIIFSVISIGISWIAGIESSKYSVEIVQNIIAHTVYNGRIFRGMIFIPIGMCFNFKKISYNMNILIMISSFFLNCILKNYFLRSYLLILTTVSFFGIILNWKLLDHPVYHKLRKMSTIMYLIHMYIWSIYYKVLYGEKTYGLDSFIIASLCGCVVALLYLKVINKFKMRAFHKRK